MKLRWFGPFALLALLLAPPACGRKPIGTDAAADGAGQLETGGDVGAGGSGGSGAADARDGAAADAPSDAPPDGSHDVAADMAVDMSASPDAPVEVGPAVDAPVDSGSDRSGGDAACGSPSDPRNCGTCGHDCTVLPRVRADRVECRDGACFIPANGCQTGWGNCTGDPERGCPSDVSLPSRCGCGVSCPATGTRLCATPTDGPPVCVATCTEIPGLTDCGPRQCIDLQTNSSHCGACNNRCNLANADSTCLAGKCAVTRCLPGYAACDPRIAQCITWLGSFYDCQGCHQSCAVGHADGTCGAAGCSRACHAGWGDCDSSSTDCETPLDSSANCGRCGAACPSDRPLCGGPRGQETCRAACAVPTPDACGTACTDLQSDPRHCGGCGTACESYQACEGGRCTPRYVKTDVLTAAEGMVSTGVPVIGPGGAYFINGSFSEPVDFNPGAGEDVRTPSTVFDTFVTKFEADGSYAWTRTWANAYVGAAAVGTDGSVIVVGSFYGTVDFDPGAGVTQLTARGDADAVVLKLSASGGLVWARAFAMTPEQGADGRNNAAVLAGDGSVIVIGEFRGQIDLDPGSATALHRTTIDDGHDVHVVKLTAAGNLVWARAFGGPMTESAGRIVADASGLLWIGGTFAGTTDLDPGPGVDAHTALGNQDGFLVRLDADGNFRDSRVYSFANYDGVDAVAFDSDGSIYVGGGSGDGTSTWVGFIQKLSPDGSQVWLKQSDGMANPVAAPGGGVLFAGAGRENETGVAIFLVSKLDRDGNPVWRIPAPTYRSYFSFAFAADATKIVISGITDGAPIDLDPGAGTDVVTAAGATITRFAF